MSLTAGTSSSSLFAKGGRHIPCYRLTPARFLVNADAEHRLGHKFAGQKCVRWVNTSQACIAEEPLDPRVCLKMPKPPARSIAVSTTFQAPSTARCLTATSLAPHSVAVVNAV